MNKNSSDHIDDEKLRSDVIQKIGEMVLEEMLFVADYRMEDWEDEPSAVELFQAVKDDLINEIQGSPWDVWAASGCLFAKLWEQFVRLNPKRNRGRSPLKPKCGDRWRANRTTSSPGSHPTLLL